MQQAIGSSSISELGLLPGRYMQALSALQSSVGCTTFTSLYNSMLWPLQIAAGADAAVDRARAAPLVARIAQPELQIGAAIALHS